jgi:transcriptional regulator with XRE-family HTH domain
MNIKIGAKIKELRKRGDITQEKLAEALGVTGQAISRWESESGYPDIEYISPIANYFNVTTDYLFDHDTAAKQKRIKQYENDYNAHILNGKPAEERIAMMRIALAEFPGNEVLLSRLADALYWKWIGVHIPMIEDEHANPTPDYEKECNRNDWQEAVKILEGLHDTASFDWIRSLCRVQLAQLYGRIGENEKAVQIINKCGYMHHAQERVMATAVWGKDRRKHQQLLLQTSLTIFKEALFALTNEINDPSLTLSCNRLIIEIYKLISGNEDHAIYFGGLHWLYYGCARELAKLNRTGEAQTALEQAFAYVRRFDELVRITRNDGIEVMTDSPLMDLVALSSVLFVASEQTPLMLEAAEQNKLTNFLR